MSRIQDAFLVTRSIERGEPQPTALDKLVTEHMKNMSATIEQQFTDMLTFGHGFAELTSFPPKLKRLPFQGVVRIDDIT